MRRGYAWSVEAPGAVSWSRKSCQEMIPGMMMTKGMASFSRAAKMIPSWPCFRLLAARVRWVMNWLRPQ